MIWLFIALITAAVIGALLLPLFREVSGRISRQKQEITIFADQLAELDREVAAGLISADAAAATRTEIERRILVSGERNGSTAGEPASGVAASGRMIAVVLVASLAPLAAFAIYLATGTPGEPSHPFVAANDRSAGEAMAAGEMMEAVAKAGRKAGTGAGESRGLEAAGAVLQHDAASRRGCSSLWPRPRTRPR